MARDEEIGESASFPQAEDVLPARRVLSLLGATLLFGGLLVSVAWALLGASERRVRPQRHFPEQRIASPASVREPQGVFALDHRGEALNADARRALEQYGWVDRARGLIRIPVEQAMDLVSGEVQ